MQRVGSVASADTNKAALGDKSSQRRKKIKVLTLAALDIIKKGN